MMPRRVGKAFCLSLLGLGVVWLLGDSQLSPALSFVGGSAFSYWGRLDYTANARWILMEICALNWMFAIDMAPPSAEICVRYGSMARLYRVQRSRLYGTWLAWGFIIVALCLPADAEAWWNIAVYITHLGCMEIGLALLRACGIKRALIWMIAVCAVLFSLALGWISPHSVPARWLSYGMALRNSSRDALHGYRVETALTTQIAIMLCGNILFRLQFHRWLERRG